VKAGKIIKGIRKSIANFVYEGKSFLEICEFIEESSRRERCQPAFPCNIGVNEVAAHYTASPNDKKVVTADSVVKLDFGVHINGHIADTAMTVILNQEYEPMLLAAEEAIDRVSKILSHGTNIKDVSMIIQKTIESYGYKSITNLCGHRVLPYVVHASPSIPNVYSPSISGKLEAGNVYAIEPFVTVKNAAGLVVEGEGGNIYHITKLKRPKDKMSRNFFEKIYRTYKTLPFTTRWFLKGADVETVKRNLGTLLTEKRIEAYPVFFERTRKPVVQAEHSFLITDKETIFLT
jgi:methionyl aminopeptidase